MNLARIIFAAGSLVALASASAVAAPQSPRALASASGGVWAVSTTARGVGASSVCVSDPARLSLWEHRGERCRRSLIADGGNKAVIEYQCQGGGFGRSEMTLLTPRTMRIATQGIARDGPYNYVLHARRMGNCRPR